MASWYYFEDGSMLRIISLMEPVEYLDPFIHLYPVQSLAVPLFDLYSGYVVFNFGYRADEPDLSLLHTGTILVMVNGLWGYIQNPYRIF